MIKMVKKHFKKKRTFKITNNELQSVINQLKKRKQINKDVLAVINRQGKMLCIHANDEEKTAIYHNVMILTDRFRIEG